MILVFAFISRVVNGIKTWIGNTFTSGWENLSNQIVLLLALIDNTASLTTHDNPIKPLLVEEIYSRDYCDKNGIIYTRPNVTGNYLSYNGDVKLEVKANTTTYGHPYLYKDDVVLDENLNYMLPRATKWDYYQFFKYFVGKTTAFNWAGPATLPGAGTVTINLNSEIIAKSAWPSVCPIWFDSVLYLSIYGLLYIFDTNYDIVTVNSLPLPVKYWFIYLDKLYFYSIQETIVKVVE